MRMLRGVVMAGEAGSVDGRCIDAMDEGQVRALIADVEAKYNGIDFLVNAVGGSTIVENPSVPIEEMSFEDWQKLINFNLTATFLFCNAVIPGMKKAGSGKIVSLASVRSAKAVESRMKQFPVVSNLFITCCHYCLSIFSHTVNRI